MHKQSIYFNPPILIDNSCAHKQSCIKYLIARARKKSVTRNTPLITPLTPFLLLINFFRENLIDFN
jgi:hypothetical protein